MHQVLGVARKPVCGAVHSGGVDAAALNPRGVAHLYVVQCRWLLLRFAGLHMRGGARQPRCIRLIPVRHVDSIFGRLWLSA